MVKKIFPASIIFFIAAVFTAFTPFRNHSPAPLKPVLKTIIVDAGHGFPDGGAEGEYSNESTIALAIAMKLGKQLEQELPDSKIIYTRTTPELPAGLKDKRVANRYRAQMANEAHGDLFISIHLNSGSEHYRTEVIGHRTETYYATVGKGAKKKRVKRTHRVPITRHIRVPGTVEGTETYVWASDKNDLKKQFVGSNQEDEFGEKTDSGYQYFESPEAKIMASLRTRKYFANSCAIASFVEDEFVKSGRPSRGVKQRDWEAIWVLQATAMPSILVETGFISTPADEAYLNSVKGQDEVSNCIKNAVLRYKAYLEGGTPPPPGTETTTGR